MSNLNINVQLLSRKISIFLDYSNQGGWGMSEYLKGCTFEHTEQSFHFESFNNESAIVKEAQAANMLSQ